MGETNLAKFKKAISAANDNDSVTFAKEMLMSKACNDTKTRIPDLIKNYLLKGRTDERALDVIKAIQKN